MGRIGGGHRVCKLSKKKTTDTYIIHFNNTNSTHSISMENTIGQKRHLCITILHKHASWARICTLINALSFGVQKKKKARTRKTVWGHARVGAAIEFDIEGLASVLTHKKKILMLSFFCNSAFQGEGGEGEGTLLNYMLS